MDRINELQCKALLLDISGVLYDGSHMITGASAFVQRMREQGKILRFVTNTATRSADVIVAELTRFGISASRDELYTAPQAAREYIQQKGLRPYSLLHSAIAPDFAGLETTNPNCVLLGDAKDALSYGNLNKAFRILYEGGALIGIGLNKYFRADDGITLDAGAFIQALSWASDVEPVIIGKPSHDFYRQVVSSTGCAAEDCLMIGDDVLADVKGAMDAGIQGCLVKTGKYRDADLQQLPLGALLADSVDAIVNPRI